MSDRSDELLTLEQELRAPALNVRIGALNQLAKMDSTIAVPALKRLVAEKDFMLRRLAVMGLANHVTDESFVSLTTLIDREEDHSVLAEAANSIFEFGDRSVPILLNLFENSSNWLVRQTIISVLVETDQYDVLFEVATLAIADETQTVKEMGILAMGKVWRSPLAEQAFEVIRDLAQDEFWRNRWRATIALAGCQLPEARDLLVKLQTDEHFRVVAAALEVLSA
jgi:HEAT repeat protein